MAFPSGDAIDFYLEMATIDDRPTNNFKSYDTVRKLMLQKFSWKKTEVEIMSEAVNLKYDGSDIRLLTEADKCYMLAKLNDGSCKFVMLIESIKTDKS